MTCVSRTCDVGHRGAEALKTLEPETDLED